AAGCAGGGIHRAPRSGSHRQAPVHRVQKQAPRARPAHHRVAPRKVSRHANVARPRSHVVKAHAKPKRHSNPATPSRPQRRGGALPWQPEGTSLVAHVHVRQIAVYRSPRAKRPMLRLARHDELGTERTFLVRATWHDWLRVYLPTRPNGSLGWVR